MGNSLPGFLLTRLSTAQVLTASVAALGLGAVLIALAPIWGVAVVGALICGIGLGSTSGALNSAYASLGTQAINLVNAVFGVGSMVSPLLVAGLGHLGLQWPFAVVALCCALTFLVSRIYGVPGIYMPVGTPITRPLEKREVRLLMLFALIMAWFRSWSRRLVK